MDPNKPQKGSLISAFRKAAFVVLAGVALTAGASNEASAQTTVPYGQQGVTATMQQEQYKPWADNASYQNQIRVQADRDRIAMQRAQSNARVQSANIQQQRTQAIARHNQSLQRLRDRKAKALDYANLASQWAAQEQGFRSRSEQIHLNLEQLRLSQEQNMLRLVERLDNQFSRQEPYKSMLQQSNAPRR